MMPARPARPCRYPGCGELTIDKRGYCDEHRYSWEKRADAPARITGRRLQRIRRELFREQPLCVKCQEVGRVSLATERDHIVPLSQGGADIPSNTQALCPECHAIKTAKEITAGHERDYARADPAVIS